jgi:MFS family permease
MGRFNDKYGPRRVVTACGIALGLGYILMSQISTIHQLYLIYSILIAFGIGGAFTPIVSTIARWFVKKRGIMTGLVVAGVGSGTMIMAPLARWLISSYTWRTSYIIIGIITLLVLIIAAQFFKRDPGQMSLVPYGEEVGNRDKQAFKPKELLLKDSIHTKQLWLLCGAFFLGFLPVGTTLVHIVIHSTDLGFTEIAAANILAMIGGISIIGRITMGALADRIGSKRALYICLALLSISQLIVITAHSLEMLYFYAVILGLAYGGINANMSLITADLFGTHTLGATIGIIFAFDSAGGATGSVTAGRIFDLTSSYELAFKICLIASITALVLIYLLKPISWGKRNNDY